ncbi:hypothetical protein GNI_091930, partial [Gregarina niphandrodes]
WRSVLASWAFAFRASSVGAFAEFRAEVVDAALAILAVDFHGLIERFDFEERREWIQGVVACVVGALGIFNERCIASGVDETSTLRALGDRLCNVKALLWSSQKFAGLLDTLSEDAAATATADRRLALDRGGPPLESSVPVVLFEHYLSNGKETPSRLRADLREWRYLLMLAVVKAFTSLKGHQANVYAADTLLYLQFFESQFLVDLILAFQDRRTPVHTHLWKLAALLLDVMGTCVGSIPPKSAGSPPPRIGKPAPGAVFLASNVSSENSLWQKALVVCLHRAFDESGSYAAPTKNNLASALVEIGIRAVYACVTREGAILALPKAFVGDDASPWGLWMAGAGRDSLLYLCPVGSGWSKKLCRNEREFLWTSKPEYVPDVSITAPGPGPGNATLNTNGRPATKNRADCRPNRHPLIVDFIRWAALHLESPVTSRFIVPIICALAAMEPEDFSKVLCQSEGDAITLSYLIADLLVLPKTRRHVRGRNGSGAKETGLQDTRTLVAPFRPSYGTDIWLFEQVLLETMVPYGLHAARLVDIDAPSHLDTCETFATVSSALQTSQTDSDSLWADKTPFVIEATPSCKHPSAFPVRFVPPSVSVITEFSLAPQVTPRQRLLDMLLACIHAIQGGATFQKYPWLPHPVEIMLGLRSLSVCLSKRYLFSPVKSEVLEALRSIAEEDVLAYCSSGNSISVDEMKHTIEPFVRQSLQAAELLACCLSHKTLAPPGSPPAAEFPLRTRVCNLVRARLDIDQEPLARPWLETVDPLCRPVVAKWLVGQARLAVAEIDALVTGDANICAECPTATSCVQVGDDDIDLMRRLVGVVRFCRHLAATDENGQIRVIAKVDRSYRLLADSAEPGWLVTYQNMFGYLVLQILLAQMSPITTCLTKGTVLANFASRHSLPLARSLSNQLYSIKSSTSSNMEFVSMACVRLGLFSGVQLYRFTAILRELILQPEVMPENVLTTREEAQDLLDTLSNAHRLLTSVVHNADLTAKWDYIRLTENALSAVLERVAVLVVEVDKEFLLRQLSEGA